MNKKCLSQSAKLHIFVVVVFVVVPGGNKFIGFTKYHTNINLYYSVNVCIFYLPEGHNTYLVVVWIANLI